MPPIRLLPDSENTLHLYRFLFDLCSYYRSIPFLSSPVLHFKIPLFPYILQKRNKNDSINFDFSEGAEIHLNRLGKGGPGSRFTFNYYLNKI